MQRADSCDTAWEAAKSKILSASTCSAKAEVDELLGSLKLSSWDELIYLLCKEAEELGLACLNELKQSEDYRAEEQPVLEFQFDVESRAEDLLHEFEQVLLKSQRLKVEQESVLAKLNSASELESNLSQQLGGYAGERQTLERQLESLAVELCTVVNCRCRAEEEANTFELQIEFNAELTSLRLAAAQAQEYCFLVAQRCLMEQEDRFSLLVERSARTSDIRARVRKAVSPSSRIVQCWRLMKSSTKLSKNLLTHRHCLRA